MARIDELISEASEILRLSGISEARREAKSLLALALNRGASHIFAHPEYDLTEEEHAKFNIFVKRRSNREPFQHISGKQEFWGLDFRVSPEVLIPRPETEHLVEAAIDILRESLGSEICEVGIGSGCISISILNDIKTARAIGLDISENALLIAKENAEVHNVSDRLTLKISDLFDELSDEKFCLIVANPPYVPASTMGSLQPEVRNFDPLIALTDGKNGLSIIEKIIKRSPAYLMEGGFLLLEIGFDQSDHVSKMFDGEIWGGIEILADLQGIPRIVKAEIHST